MADKRDPRTDPRPGDVLRENDIIYVITGVGTKNLYGATIRLDSRKAWAWSGELKVAIKSLATRTVLHTEETP